MLVPGDWVEIRPRAAVAETLGQDGTLDALPFLPEMVRYCGARLPVRARAGAACVEASNRGERGRRAQRVRRAERASLR